MLEGQRTIDFGSVCLRYHRCDLSQLLNVEPHADTDGEALLEREAATYSQEFPFEVSTDSIQHFIFPNSGCVHV